MKKLFLLFVSVSFCIHYSWAIAIDELAKNEGNELISIRKQTLQLSPEEIKQKTTSDLFEECLNYPYIIDVFFYNDIQEGFDSLVAEFNGFEELQSRKDFAECILAKMEKFPKEVSNINSSDSISKGLLSFKSIVIEMLLSKNITLFEGMEQFKRLKQCVDTCLTLKVAHPEIFGSISTKSTQHIKNKFAKEMGSKSTNHNAVTIYTPNGSVVPDTYQITGDDNTLSPSELAALASFLYTNYEGAELLGGLTNRYNCHGYAWHVSEGGNNVWIGYNSSTAENIYWTDGSYIEVPEPLATKVSYDESTANHSAVRLNSTWYKSKWGEGPLVKHHPNACPYNTSMPKKYYKKRSEIFGFTTLYDSSSFSLSNCTGNATVQWSVSGYYSNFITIENDTSSTNMCHVSIINAQNFPGGNITLTANIMYNDTIIESVSKVIHAVGIFGDMVPCGYETYYVNPRPDNTTVEWSVSGSNIVSSTDTVPSGFLFPEPDTYVIVNRNHRNIYGTLTATVKSGGNVVAVLERIIDTTGGLSGTWYQEATASDTVNATPKPFYRNAHLEIIPNRRVYLESELFEGASITYQSNGFHITGKTNSNGVISFVPNLPIFANSGSVTINGTYPNSCQKFSITLYTINTDPIPFDPLNPLQVNTSGSTFEFSLGEDAFEKIGTTNETKWRLTIQDNAGNRIFDSALSNGSKHVNTSRWKKGLYIATAQIGGKNYSVKFCITQ